jgi:hypothetical protein
MMIELPYTIYKSLDDAENAVAIYTAGEAVDGDGVTYKAIPDPLNTGKAIVKAYDEDGEFIMNM